MALFKHVLTYLIIIAIYFSTHAVNGFQFFVLFMYLASFFHGRSLFYTTLFSSTQIGPGHTVGSSALKNSSHLMPLNVSSALCLVCDFVLLQPCNSPITDSVLHVPWKQGTVPDTAQAARLYRSHLTPLNIQWSLIEDRGMIWSFYIPKKYGMMAVEVAICKF